MRLQGRRNGVEPRLKGGQGGDHLRDRRPGRRELLQQVENVPRFQDAVRVVSEQRLQGAGFRGVGGRLGQQGGEALVDLGDDVVLDQRLVGIDDAAVAGRHQVVAAAAHRLENRLDQLGAVLRVDAQGVADLVGQAAALEVEGDESHVLFGIGLCQRHALQEGGRERVLTVVGGRRVRRGGAVGARLPGLGGGARASRPAPPRGPWAGLSGWPSAP